jgi:hypothetical protein
MKLTEMKLTEMIKQSCIRLVGLILITIPLMACYPIMFFLGFSDRISTISTVCLSIVAYFLMIRHVEPFLCRVLPLELVPLILLGVIFVLRILPFTTSKTQERLEENRLKRIELKKVIS